MRARPVSGCTYGARLESEATSCWQRCFPALPVHSGSGAWVGRDGKDVSRRRSRQCYRRRCSPPCTARTRSSRDTLPGRDAPQLTVVSLGTAPRSAEHTSRLRLSSAAWRQQQRTAQVTHRTRTAQTETRRDTHSHRRRVTRRLAAGCTRTQPMLGAATALPPARAATPVIARSLTTYCRHSTAQHSTALHTDTAATRMHSSRLAHARDDAALASPPARCDGTRSDTHSLTRTPTRHASSAELPRSNLSFHFQPSACSLVRCRSHSALVAATFPLWPPTRTAGTRRSRCLRRRPCPTARLPTALTSTPRLAPRRTVQPM